MDSPIPPDLQPLPPPTPPSPTPSQKTHIILGCFGIALGLLLAFFRAWIWSYGLMTAESWGFAMGSAVLPALIAAAIALRKSVRSFNRFGLWFSGLSLVFFILMSRTPPPFQQHVGDLMKEAAGTKAVDNSGPGTLDNLIREMMRGVLDDRKAFDREVAQFTPALEKLYGVETFSSPEAIQKTIDAVNGIVAADQRYSKKLEGITDKIQVYVDSSHLGETDKRDFMEGVRKSYGNVKTLQIRRQAMGTEKQWGDATLDLYRFALANASKIQVDGEVLRIGSDELRRGFKDKMQKARGLQSQLDKQNDELEKAQGAALQEAGLTPKDLGLSQSGSSAKK